MKLNSTQLYSTSLPGSLNKLEDLMTRGIKRHNIDNVWPGSFPEINLNGTPENTFGKYQLRR